MKSSQGDSNPLDNNPLSGTRSKPRSISGHLAAGLIAITLLVSIVTITVIYFNAIREQEASLTRKADEYTQYLVGVLQDLLWDYNEESINTICRTFLQNELVVSIVIKETSGRVVFSGKNSPYTDLIKRTGKIHSHGELLGEAEISFTRQYVKEAGRRLLVSYALTMLFVSMSLVLLTHLLLRVFLKKPLDTLDKIVKPYIAGIYDSPIPELPYTEFQGFGNTLTQMGETIRLQMKELHLQTAELEEEIEKRQKAQDELERLNENLEQRVKERTAELVAKSDELEQKNRELERFNKLFVNRELRMIELKERIGELEMKNGA
ncbi:MAG: hypothetical protein BWK76_00120 [Desulfobulbaceae bacterium A2]|nr:MAG: hypothetical protein BWK76_00120 [Desulfobulbaceae bacterium A2]